MFTIEAIPSCRIAYVRQVGPYGPANSQAMEALKSWARSRQLLVESAVLFGIPQDHPETTAPNKCRYDAGIVIPREYPLDDTVSDGELAGGDYAVFQAEHTAEGVQAAWAGIFPSLQQSHYQIDNKPIIERYTGRKLANHMCEICVPVKPL
ncbi:AraC family transcriptional regulator [Paenibacillus ginsengarvi]|uniref:DNA gyrase inhibitor n=1 Tax=Paenibacillus ginsengarvi TaxID=400777 RepID=A0A3B0CMY9_9BACL|nr:GyrI-like domain-containing protein [Paenibacillus ginsengarvi]RKN85757.1 DNA gyrase inhibitor [Paenibacillus ginsengarvi]